TTPGTFSPVSAMHSFASSAEYLLGASSSTPSKPSSLSSLNFSSSVSPGRTMPILTAFLNFRSVGFSSAANDPNGVRAIPAIATTEVETNSRRLICMANLVEPGSRGRVMLSLYRVAASGATNWHRLRSQFPHRNARPKPGDTVLATFCRYSNAILRVTRKPSIGDALAHATAARFLDHQSRKIASQSQITDT